MFNFKTVLKSAVLVTALVSATSWADVTVDIGSAAGTTGVATTVSQNFTADGVAYGFQVDITYDAACTVDLTNCDSSGIGGGADLSSCTEPLPNLVRVAISNLSSALPSGSFGEIGFTCSPAGGYALTGSNASATDSLSGPVTTVVNDGTLTISDAPAPAYASSPVPGSTVNFGTQDIGAGATATQTVTVQNTGNANMTGVVASLGGANPGDFTITSFPSSVIAGSASSDVVMTCDPSAAGLRTATLSVTHNAANIASPATYTLECTGTSQPVVTFTPASGNTLIVQGVGDVTGYVTISNIGSAPTTDYSCSLDAAAAECSITSGATGGPIAAGGSAQVGVTCTLVQGENIGPYVGALQCAVNGDFDGSTGTPDTAVNGRWDVSGIGAIYVIPTLSEYGLLLMILALMGAGFFMVRRRA